MKYTVSVVILLAMAVLLGMAAPYMTDHVRGEPKYQAHEVEAAKESIALSLLGQLQLSVGDIMWLKSMEYLHVGVIQRMPTRAEEERGYRRRDALNVAAGLGHTEGVNMVLDADRDWRGIFGEVERNVKPYTGAHVHDDPVELIPWYQLAVKLNPTLERLYTLGAFYLADFANEPGEAREMLEAGKQANPYSFEIHGALGRLYVDFAERLGDLDHHHHDDVHDVHDDHDDHQGHDDHPIETPLQAYAEALELLTRAVELAHAQRKQMAARREIFDDFQNQVFGESYLFLSRAHMALGQYEDAIAVAEKGYEEVSQYNQRNLLLVQARVARKAMEGEAIDAQELAMLDAAGDVSQLTNVRETGRSRAAVDDAEAPVLPVSVLAGIVPPEAVPVIADEAVALEILKDARAFPMQPPATRAGRLGRAAQEVEALLEVLVEKRFAAVHTWHGETVHTLLPPGLYVALGHYGFDFWEAMAREARELHELGVSVDLVADAQKR